MSTEDTSNDLHTPLHGEETQNTRPVLLRKALESQRIATVASPCRPELTVGRVVTELGSLLEMRMTAPGSNRGQVEAIEVRWKQKRSGGRPEWQPSGLGLQGTTDMISNTRNR